MDGVVVQVAGGDQSFAGADDIDRAGSTRRIKIGLDTGVEDGDHRLGMVQIQRHSEHTEERPEQRLIPS